MKSHTTKLNQNVQKVICDALERGHSLSTAAAMAGVSARSALRWKARGRAEDKRLDNDYNLPVKQEEAIYLDFFHATEKAVALAVDKYLKILMTGDANEVKNAERILTRCFPGIWGDKYQLQERIEEFQLQMEKVMDTIGKGGYVFKY